MRGAAGATGVGWIKLADEDEKEPDGAPGRAPLAGEMVARRDWVCASFWI
jgi:hypothetical protein